MSYLNHLFRLLTISAVFFLIGYLIGHNYEEIVEFFTR